MLLRMPQIISAVADPAVGAAAEPADEAHSAEALPGSGGQLIRVRLRNFSGRCANANWATIAAKEYPTTCAAPSPASSMAMRSSRKSS